MKKMEESAFVKLKFFDPFILQVLLLLFLCIPESICSPLGYLKTHLTTDKNKYPTLSEITPSGSPEPFLPLIAPSPLIPFTNTTVPKLSGFCMLNFTASETLMSTTAIDCWTVFAPVLANLICCPQLEATLSILIGQSSKSTNELALNGTHAKHCLSDIKQILVSQGGSDSLQKICSVHSLNLTQGSCPVIDVDEFENIVDTSKLIASCEKIEPVGECCDKICQNAILEASSRIALRSSDISSMDGSRVLPEQSTRIHDCKSIVLHWLASKLDPYESKKILRGISNCKVNKACPLVFPDLKNVAEGCGTGITNQTECCMAVGSYVSHLQKQSFITNLQALDCASSLGRKLRRSNITEDVYSLCHISLKDFSLQVGNQAIGCLLPSLPSDATFDASSGISFICDLNDNIPAPWPTTFQASSSTSCNKTVKIPALPAVANAQIGLYNDDIRLLVIVASSVILMIFP